MIAFIEGGMTLPMGRITKDYLCNHRICPYQCASNLFKILGNVDALNEHLGLRLTWHDIVHLYECHKQNGGFTSNPNLLSLDSSRVSPNLTRG